MDESRFELEPYGRSETKRPTVERAEAILNKPFRCLDEGFVRLVDYMGDDRAIVQAARVSYGAGTKKVSGDRGLIRYLMRNRHTTPFEMVELKFHVSVPMDAWRQWIRHRTANVNEYSTRYSEAIDLAQRTLPEEWRSQSSDNKQGSGEFLDESVGSILSESEYDLHRQAREVYEARLRVGVAREQARKDLPLSTYTEAYWKMDLHNLFHFLSLRMHPHAQKEIREYAEIMGEEIVKGVVPIAYEAFADYRLNSVNLSGLDVEAMSQVIAGRSPEDVAEDIFDNKRERGEFLKKCGRFTKLD